MVGQQYAWPRPGQQGGALLVVVELHDGDEAEGEHGPRQGHRHLGVGKEPQKYVWQMLDYNNGGIF